MRAPVTPERLDRAAELVKQVREASGGKPLTPSELRLLAGGALVEIPDLVEALRIAREALLVIKGLDAYSHMAGYDAIGTAYDAIERMEGRRG